MPQPNHDPRTPEPFGNSPGSFCVDLAKAKVPSDGSSFWPCKIEKIETLQLCNLEKTWELGNNLPGFPDKMTQLKSLTILVSTELLENPTTVYTLAPFSSSLRSFTFGRIPLIKPFSAIKTLTHFTLYNHFFARPLDILLEFLEQNRSLECAILFIGFPHAPHRCSAKDPIKLNKLTYLQVNGRYEQDTEALMEKLDLRKSTTVVKEWSE